MDVLKKFIRRFTMNRRLRQLNAANTFQAEQHKNMSPAEIEKQRHRQASAHLREDWRSSATVINMNDTAPDTDTGRAFLSTLEAADIHYLAGEIHYDARYDEEWALAFASHPKCDLGTGWLLFLGSGSPMTIETYLWDRDGDANPFGPFETDVRRNDVIVARMNEGAFSSRNFVPREPDRIHEHKIAMKAALAEGKRLRWAIPDDAFNGLKGSEARRRFEKSGDVVLEPFEDWLANQTPNL